MVGLKEKQRLPTILKMHSTLFLVLALAISVYGIGMPLIEDADCERTDSFLFHEGLFEIRPCYYDYYQADGVWVQGNLTNAFSTGGLLPPRDRLISRRMTKPNGEQRIIPRPYVETVWESYNSYPMNYDSCPYESAKEVNEKAYVYRLKDVPVTSTDGMHSGADIVDIGYAFADANRCTNIATDCEPYVCGLHLFKNIRSDGDRYLELLEDIQALKKKGAVVNLAFGGDEWGNLMFSTPSMTTANAVVDDIIKTALELNVDGINLIQEAGMGTITMGHDSESTVQLYIIDALRAGMPSQMTLTYTFPGDEVTFPFRDIVKYGHPYLDHINVHMANTDSMIMLMELGVPQNKLAWGIPIGCNDPSIGDWGLEDTISIAKISRDHGFAGVFEWSINRDTNGAGWSCCPAQTGMPDGMYIANIADVCNAERLPVSKLFRQGGTYSGHSTCTIF